MPKTTLSQSIRVPKSKLSTAAKSMSGICSLILKRYSQFAAAGRKFKTSPEYEFQELSQNSMLYTFFDSSLLGIPMSLAPNQIIYRMPALRSRLFKF